MNHRLILLAFWLSAATTPAMAHDHNPRNEARCPAGTILLVTMGVVTRLSCVFPPSFSPSVPGSPGDPGDPADYPGRRDVNYPPPRPASAFSGDLNADADLAIRNCVDSSVVSEIEADAKKNRWSLTLRYAPIDNPDSWGHIVRDENLNMVITINSAKHKNHWHSLATTLLHEYYHAKDILDCGCPDPAEEGAPWEGRKKAYEDHTERRAHIEYERIFDKPAPGSIAYKNPSKREEYDKPPPPCYK